MNLKVILLLMLFTIGAGCKQKNTQKQDWNPDVAIKKIPGQITLEDGTILNCRLLSDSNDSTGIILSEESGFDLIVQLKEPARISKIKINNFYAGEKVPFNTLIYRTILSGITPENKDIKVCMKTAGDYKIAGPDKPFKTQEFRIGFEAGDMTELAIGDLFFFDGESWLGIEPEKNDGFLLNDIINRHVENAVYNSIYSGRVNLTNDYRLITNDFRFYPEKKELSVDIEGKKNIRDYTSEINDFIAYREDFNNAEEFIKSLGTDYLSYNFRLTGKWELTGKKDNHFIISFYGNQAVHNEQMMSFYDYVYSTEPPSINADTENTKVLEYITIDVSQPPADKVQLKNENISLYMKGLLQPLTYADLQNLSSEELAYLRNEFYARKGYVFKTDRMKNYFSEKLWYKPQYDDVTSMLSETELDNIFFIKSIEEGKKINESPTENDLISSLYREGQVRKLADKDLAGLSIHQLGYLRNEFYARKGFIFRTKKYRDYFSGKEWYKPEHDNVDGQLTGIEKENIALIRLIEKEQKNQ